MQTIDAQDEKERAALERGYLLASRNGIDRPRFRDAIWVLLEEAVETLKSLPDRERGWLLSADRAHWPANIHVPIQEWQGIWNDRVQSGMPAYDEVAVKIRGAAPDAIDRMLVVMGWLRFMRGSKVARDRAIIQALAAHAPIDAIIARASGIRSRQAVFDVKYRQIANIEAELRARLGVGR